MAPREKAQQRQGELTAARLAVIAAERPPERDGTPKGWRPIRVKAYRCGDTVVIIDGADLEMPEESDPDSHNCDAAGCRWNHVLATFTMPRPLADPASQ